MAQEYPYSVSTGRVKDFFASIQRMGVPARINTSVLPSLGFKSTNDRAIVSILKALNLIDQSGVPTSLWQALRSKQTAPGVLAERVRAAYSDLFTLYPDANARSENEIRDFMQARSKAGERVVSAMASTFKVLCSMADFSTTSQGQAQAAPNTDQGVAMSLSGSPANTPNAASPVNASTVSTPQVTINLQLQLPEGADPEYIDNVFESIARHLLGREMREDVQFIDEEQSSSNEEAESDEAEDAS